MQFKRWVGLLALPLVLAACGGGGSSSAPPGQTTGDFDTHKNCQKGETVRPVLLATSPEKLNYMAKLGGRFNQSSVARQLNDKLGNCFQIQVYDVSSGEAARLLELKDVWSDKETDKAKPAIWSPASSIWVREVAEVNDPSLVPSPASIARTPVVLAMPEPMARTLGWPTKPISFKTLHDLCLDPKGWGSYGPNAAQWGQFKLAKTNPYTSTTGTNMLLMQNYAAAGKTKALTLNDVARGTEFSKQFESCVIHYGDTTGNILQRMFDRDFEGKALNYVSAVAVEEISLINYNLGNPTSKILPPSEERALKGPNRPLVAIYPSDGSLASDDPMVVLGPKATWVTPQQRQVGEAFKAYALTPASQTLAGQYGFRPANPRAPVGGRVSEQYGANAAQPVVTLHSVPSAVVSAARRQWEQIRKPTNVLLLADVSGSMGEKVGDNPSDPTKMQAAVQAAKNTLAPENGRSHFRPTDRVGLWTFTTDDPGTAMKLLRLREVAPLGGELGGLVSSIENLDPQSGTPLYDALVEAYRYMKSIAEPGRINAIVLLSDGKDERSFDHDLGDLLRLLKGRSEVTDPAPVRIFPIAYGKAASLDILTQIAEASGGQVFDSTDPKRINAAFQGVIDNF